MGKIEAFINRIKDSSNPNLPMLQADMENMGSVVLPENPRQTIRAAQERLPDVFWISG